MCRVRKQHHHHRRKVGKERLAVPQPTTHPPRVPCGRRRTPRCRPASVQAASVSAAASCKYTFPPVALPRVRSSNPLFSSPAPLVQTPTPEARSHHAPRRRPATRKVSLRITIELLGRLERPALRDGMERHHWLWRSARAGEAAVPEVFVGSPLCAIPPLQSPGLRGGVGKAPWLRRGSPW